MQLAVTNAPLPSPLPQPRAAADPYGTFLPQFRSPALPDGIAWGPGNGNCGPTSVVNALRLVDLDVPGFSGERSQRAIDAARVLMTGANDPTGATNKWQQRDALVASGAHVDVSYSLLDGLAAVRRGAALLLGGDRAAPGWPRRSDDPPPTGLAAHAVVVARALDPAPAPTAPGSGADRYLVLDPALDAPVVVGVQQLRDFVQLVEPDRMLRPGLAVSRPPAAIGPAGRPGDESTPGPAR